MGGRYLSHSAARVFYIRIALDSASLKVKDLQFCVYLHKCLRSAYLDTTRKKFKGAEKYFAGI